MYPAKPGGEQTPGLITSTLAVTSVLTPLQRRQRTLKLPTATRILVFTEQEIIPGNYPNTFISFNHPT